MAKQQTGKIIWPAPVLVISTQDGRRIRASIGVSMGETLDWDQLGKHATWLCFGENIATYHVEHGGQAYRYNEQPFATAKPPGKRTKAPKACPHCGGEL